EETDDDRRLPMFLPVRHRQKLVDQLAGGISPSALVRRPQHEVGVLAEWQPYALAIDLRRRGDDDEGAALVRMTQNGFGAVDVCFDRADRRLDDEPHAHCCCEMKYDVCLIDQC